MHIWGLKTLSLFDVWSFEHLISGISLGSLLVDKKDDVISQLPREYYYRYHVYKILTVAFIWEALEHYLETGLAGAAVEYWFQGVEYWGNRLITDPALMVIGYFLVQRYRYLLWPGRVFSAVWLFLHIFIFPHSMYLHTLFDK